MKAPETGRECAFGVYSAVLRRGAITGLALAALSGGVAANEAALHAALKRIETECQVETGITRTSHKLRTALNAAELAGKSAEANELQGDLDRLNGCMARKIVASSRRAPQQSDDVASSLDKAVETLNEKEREAVEQLAR